MMNYKQRIILIGGGEHCKACIEVIEVTQQYYIAGILDQPNNLGKTILGYEIIGADGDLESFVDASTHFLITVGHIKTAATRVRLFELLVSHRAKLATIISPLAHVSSYATIAPGTIVMHGVLVNAAAQIGENCILNTGCIIEHDAFIEDHTHISTHAVINGGCHIGRCTFIGSNTTVVDHKHICDYVVVGAGSVITKTISHPGTYAGNPLRNF